MRSRAIHTLFSLATFVVAALLWLVPSVARADQASFEASFSASIVLHTPAPAPAAAPIGPATANPGDRAPLCDPRGAITFASAPQMQDVEVTLDTGLTLDDCLGTARSSDANQVAPGRAPLPSDASGASSDAAVLHAAVVLAASGRELLPAPGPSTTCSRPGIRSTVDRPPRA